MCLRFRFKIRLIIAFVLCLGGGIGEISSQCRSFLCQMLCILAVFERQNKCSPVATTSTPKYSSSAPSFSRAVTPADKESAGSARPTDFNPKPTTGGR